MFEKNNLPSSSALIMEASDSTETSTGLNGIASHKTAVFIHRHVPIAKGAHECIETGASLLYWQNS
jgi:hypothetical protein